MQYFRLGSAMEVALGPTLAPMLGRRDRKIDCLTHHYCDGGGYSEQQPKRRPLPARPLPALAMDREGVAGDEGAAVVVEEAAEGAAERL
jgi:hypothetical protein